jgi:E1-E2 ATPase
VKATSSSSLNLSAPTTKASVAASANPIQTKTMTTTTSTTSLSQDLRDLLQELGTSLDTGLTNDQVRCRRLETSYATNVVNPPIHCPSWVCCLLPCIKSFPSMKAFRSIVPNDAEVKRSGRWVRYDATSLLVGDIIRIEAGDIVPADCVVLTTNTRNRGHNREIDEPLLVDLKLVTGHGKPASAKPSAQLFWGGRVVQGTAICAVTAVGRSTRVAELIRSRRFPPPALSDDDGGDGFGGAAATTTTSDVVDGEDDDDEESGSNSSSNSNSGPAEQGISLLSRRLT